MLKVKGAKVNLNILLLCNLQEIRKLVILKLQIVFHALYLLYHLKARLNFEDKDPRTDVSTTPVPKNSQIENYTT